MSYLVRREFLLGGSDADQETFKVPQKLYTVPALEYCGLQRPFASFLNNVFDPDEQPEYDMTDFMGTHIVGMGKGSKIEDAGKDDCDEKWNLTLRALHIKDDVREGIMDPEFRDIRLTKTAKMWAYETVSCIWEFFQEFNRLVLSQKKVLDTPNFTWSASAPIDSLITPLLNQDEILIYKGGSLASMTQGFVIDDVIKGEKLPLQWIWAGGDYSMSSGYKVAERYAAYFARRTAGAAPACVLRFSLQKDMLGETKVENWDQLERALSDLGSVEMGQRCFAKVEIIKV